MKAEKFRNRVTRGGDRRRPMHVNTMIEPLEEAYRAYADELIRYATTMVGPDRASDVVADTLLSVYAHRDGVDDVEHLRAFLYRAVFHHSVDANRSRDRRRRREERADCGYRQPSAPTSSERSMDARRALDVLSEQQRAVVFLTYWADRTPAEVAHLLDVQEGTVRKQLARARKRLREVLDA